MGVNFPHIALKGRGEKKFGVHAQWEAITPRRLVAFGMEMCFDIIMSKIHQRHFAKKFESSAPREAGEHFGTTKSSSQHHYSVCTSVLMLWTPRVAWGTTTDHRTWLQVSALLHPPCHLVACRLHSASVPLWAICTLISSEQCYTFSNYSTSRTRTLNSKLCVQKSPFFLEMCL